eukprot:scpid94280/ scgid27774/ 
MFFSGFGLPLGRIITSVFRWQHSEDIPLIWRTTRQVLLVILLMVSFIPFLNNMLTVTFTIMGLATSHTFLVFSVLAMGKVILIDIFHIGDLDKTISPDLAARQQCYEEAIFSLQDTLVMNPVTAIFDQPSGADNDLQRPITDIIDLFYPDGKLYHLAFFNLCSLESMPENLTAVNSIAKKSRQNWENKITSRYKGFLRKCFELSGLFIIPFLAAAIQMSVTGVANSGPSFFETWWSSLLLPALLFLKPLVSRILSTYRETHDTTNEYRRTNAQEIMLQILKGDIRYNKERVTLEAARRAEAAAAATTVGIPAEAAVTVEAELRAAAATTPGVPPAAAVTTTTGVPPAAAVTTTAVTAARARATAATTT